jgi:hypothetical protein
LLPYNDILLLREQLRFLRLGEAIIPYGQVDVTGQVAFDVNRQMNLMYVYCDAATDSAIDDVRAPLLRVGNVSGEHSRTVHIVYDRPYYVPVGRREFDTIEFSINNEFDKSMAFEFEKSVVTLHF